MAFPLPTDPSQPLPFGRDRHETLIVDSEQLIRQAFALDVRRGYEALFRRYYQSLCNHAVRYVYSQQAAEDIVGDVLLNFWKNSVHLHITTSYRAYLFTAVRNQAYNYLKEELGRSTVAGALPDNADAPATTDDPYQMLQLTDIHNRINQVVQQLSPQCQRVFLLSRVEGKKHREIADELNISTKTVEVHILKALAQLRKVLLTAFFFLAAYGPPS